MNTKLVASHLLYLRKQNKLTQEELAEKLKEVNLSFDRKWMNEVK